MAYIWLQKWLAHPLTRELDINNPLTTSLRRDIIKNNKFLNYIYQDWYNLIVGSIPEGPGQILELGSGGGFLKELIPDILSSDIIGCPGISSVIDGLNLPFKNSSLRAIILVNVFHHLQNARRFLGEATRVLRPGGVISMIEPWVTPWSKIIYQSLHHELFEPDELSWEFQGNGPLSGANGALPWIIFHRDIKIYYSEYPDLTISKIEPMMPIRYLLSGGVSMRNIVPDWTYPIFKKIDSKLAWLSNRTGMFSHIVLIRSK